MFPVAGPRIAGVDAKVLHQACAVGPREDSAVPAIREHQDHPALR
jgi:hypothetical protein